jgi:PPK2 family polyphosphate:nucleotide phosphotransferase
VTDFRERYRAHHDFNITRHDPADTAGLEKKEAQKQRDSDLEQIAELQERLYAEGRRALLVVIQGMDASGKDGAVGKVLGAMNPQGVRITSFKQPTEPELKHDFLWRCALALPEHGYVGVFNRSHYEEVLVVRVHPDYLAGQGIDPALGKREEFWKRRLETIRHWEEHLAASGTSIVKFFLHISREEQRERLLARWEDPSKRWKFSATDVAERGHWDAYQEAYEKALRATSTDEAPWYAIPADNKWLARTAIARIVAGELERLDPQFPQPSDEDLKADETAAKELEAESG